MTTLGWLMMTVSIGSVLALTIFCLVRVFSLKSPELERFDIAPLDIDTGDIEQAD